MARKKPIPPEYRAYAGQPFAITKHQTPEALATASRVMRAKGRYYTPGENQTFYGESVEEIFSRHKLIRGFYHVRQLNDESLEYVHVGDVIFGAGLYTDAGQTRCKELSRIVKQEGRALVSYKEKHGTS